MITVNMQQIETLGHVEMSLITGGAVAEIISAPMIEFDDLPSVIVPDTGRIIEQYGPPAPARSLSPSDSVLRLAFPGYGIPDTDNVLDIMVANVKTIARDIRPSR